MKNLSILIPAVLAGVLLTATVVAAPQPITEELASAAVMDRAAAYALARAE